MVEIPLMASTAAAAFASSSPAVLPPSKELQALIPFQGKRQDISKCASVQLSTQRLEDQGQSMQILSHYGQQYQPMLMANKPVLVDVQDSCPDSVLFSFGIAEQCTRQEKILKFLMSGSNAKGGLDVSLLSELMGYQTLAIDMSCQPYIPDDKLSLHEIGVDEPQHYLHPEKQIFIPKPLLNFVGNLSESSAINIEQNGRVLFTGSGDEMKDLLSIVSEFNLSKRVTGGSKAALLVPYFDRKRTRVNNKVSTSKSATETVAPLKSPAKPKSSSKKKQMGKHGKERNLYQKNYFHACEAFMSVLLDKNKGSMTILSLKNSCPEITEILGQFSVVIAGTGLAVLFSVACKMAANGKAPLSASRLLNTGVGFGFFWLSWAVNGLRDTIASIVKNSSKNSSKLRVKEEEIAGKIERSMNGILVRAVALAALVALRFA